MQRFFPLFVLLLSGLLLGSARVAEPQVLLTLADESRLWIEGSSTINTFTCEAGIVNGSGFFKTQQSPDHRDAVAELQVPVQQFDCGKSRMNSDFYAALKAQEYPEIRFRLDEAEMMAPAANGGYLLRVTGRLHIAGTERPVTLTVQGQEAAKGTYRATGSLPLLMSDFGVEPPTALLGMIKAHDQITVRFDLVATPQQSNYAN